MERLCTTGVILTSVLVIIYNYLNYSYEGVEIHTNIFSKGRNISKEGYNLGKKWQCVEFVKRFYYEKYNHKMPNTYGHAISFFDTKLKGTSFNKQRGLVQTKYNGKNKPSKNSIIVLKTKTKYGHVAIVKNATDEYIRIVQQNHILKEQNIKYTDNILGWLSLK